MQIKALVALLGLTLFGLVGCSAPSRPADNEVLADCFIYFYLTAYEDADHDGVRDEGEQGLEEVTFVVRGNYAHSVAGGRAVTDHDGQATIDTWSPGSCQDFGTQFSIDATVPSGFTSSTNFPIEVDGTAFSQEYAFGFMRNP